MRKFWPFTFYFLFYAALSSLMPFMVLYYQHLGFSGGQIGLLTGMTPLITLVGAPFWTGLADATHRHKLIMSLAIAGAVTVVLVISSGPVFSILLPLVLLYAFIASPVVSLADSATMSMLADKREMYGRIRLGGTIGWGIMATIAGLVIERNGLLWAFWLYAAGMALTLLVSQGLFFNKVQVRASIRGGMRTLLTNRHWLLFLAMVFVAGMGMATINNYFFPYMKEAGTNEGLMGIALTISTISEVPVMFFGNRLLRRLKSRGLLALAMGVIGIRLLLYFVFRFPAAILIIQLVHGFTFPAVMIAGVSYAYENAPEGMGATAQGLFGSVMMGFGSGAGGLMGGLLLERLQPAGMYGVMGVIVLISLLGFIIIERRTSLADSRKVIS